MAAEAAEGFPFEDLVVLTRILITAVSLHNLTPDLQTLLTP